MSNITAKNILFIGAGSNDFGLESEHDAAIYQVMPELKGHGINVFLIDENPYALSLVSLSADVVQSWEHGDGLVPQTLGLSIDMLLRINNLADFTKFMAEAGLPVITSHVVKAQDDANELLRELQVPLMIRSLHPKNTNTRQMVERLDEFEEAIDNAKTQSMTQEIIISKAINGLKEIGMEVLRDFRGNKMKIGASEDMDPIGIHTADSLSVSPTLTIQDQILEKMRMYAFQVADLLELQGVMHVQFAFDDTTGAIYIIKVSPYIDQMSSRMALVTGYPVMLVAINLAMGIALEDIVLSHDFGQKMAMMEPMMDHITVKLPIFPFGELEETNVSVNRQLNSIQKSVGSTIGFGRTFIEALEKAIRSAHFNNATFSPTNMAHVSDGALIQQLIHPEDNRVLLLIEAIKRGYEIDELAKLTNIDEFYFYQLRHLLQLELEIEKDVDSIVSLRRGKRYGLSDGLIAHFWDTDFKIIRALTKEHNIDPTYKALEPSAGEFPENARQYYSTYEEENESEQVSDNTVLVIGSGAFRLGDAASGGYATTVVLSELRRLQYHTVIMNNNASDATLMQNLADKQYLEPLEISDVMKVVELENPIAIIVPGNRRKLITALRELNQNVLILPKEKHTPSGPETTQTEFALNVFSDRHQIYPINITQHMVGEMRIVPQIVDLPKELTQTHLENPGVYQVIWCQNGNDWVDHVEVSNISYDTWLRPMPFGQVAFISKVMQVQWLRMTVRSLLDRMTEQDRKLLDNVNKLTLQTDVRLVASNIDYELHLQPTEPIDGTRFELGVGIKYYE
ncbi:carbamoyl-phosphate synthase large subunit [Leuconostoc mesenteroides subsp. mesenteroides]|uniref:ATP-binding protein n=1 Tax=Leuconostoc mesenteroides TaxID=1245 RepID=UPI000A05444E|nr:ATP-grasp domain-containing protein [Leuconostoc mesenteroides]ORI82056.1 carbamoyl-phosphate synthase large subunit [Leuconostoc mesenteroides subsp. mesenteroides]